MAGINLATAYYELIPSMKGAQQAIASQLTPAASAAGDSAGATLGSRLASAMGKSIQVGAATVVGAAGTALGVALTKGLSRLTAIDTATAKLKGLGNSASNVTEIMSDALASVKGTAFGLGDAATVAAQAVAAGIQPGTQLTATLKAVANTAAAAGTPLNAMGNIFAQVAASGKAYNGQLQQLSDQGVPIYQALATQLHTTADGVFDLASAGKISFAQFQAAAAAASGNVAAEMGTTLTGALDNLGASLGRIGAGLEGGIFPQLAPLFNSITQALAPLESAATGLGNVIGQKINPLIQNFIGLLKGGLPDLSGFGNLLAPIGAALAALGAGGLSGLVKDLPVLKAIAPGLSAIGGPIGVVTAAIAGLVATSPELRSWFGAALQAVGTALSAAFTQLQPVLAALLPVFQQLATTLSGALIQALLALTPALVQLINIVASVLTAVLPVVTQFVTLLLNFLAPAIQTVSGFLANHTPLVLGVVGAYVAWKAVANGISFGTMIAGLVKSTAASVTHAAALVADKAQTVILAAMYAGDFVRGLVASTVAVVKNTAAWVANTAQMIAHEAAQAPSVFATVAKFVGLQTAALARNTAAWLVSKAQVVASVAAQVASKAVMLATAAATGIATAAQWAWNAAMDANPIGLIIIAIAALVAAIIWVATQTTFFQDVWKAVSAWFVAVWQNVSSFFVTVWNNIIAFLTGYTNTVLSIWSAVWNGVSSFFSGIWNGIVSFFTTTQRAILTAVVGFANSVNGFWTGLWNGISSFFVSIWNGIVSGVKGYINTVVSTVTGVKNSILGFFSGAGKWLVDVGKNIIQGLIDGITGAFTWLKNTISKMVSNVIDFAKSLLGIHSPSTVFRDQVGAQIAAGMAQGITGNAHLVTNAVNSLTTVPNITAVGASSYAAAVGYPSHVTLVDSDGSLLGIMDMKIDQADDARARVAKAGY